MKHKLEISKLAYEMLLDILKKCKRRRKPEEWIEEKIKDNFKEL